MPISYTCRQGHAWQVSDQSTITQNMQCPVCGSASILEAPPTLVADGLGPQRAPSDANSHTAREIAPQDEFSTLPPDSSDEPPRPPAAALAGLQGNLPVVLGYEILGELGRGGMGVVYKARQTQLQRLVALKMILAGSYAGEDEIARFRLEGEALARLQHPHIVQIYEVGECKGLPFFSLEFVEGGSLSRSLEGKPQPPRQAAEMVEKLARAIHAAHERGIVHRDLKPANVLVTKEGSPKITDFGLAKQLDSQKGHTQTGDVMGTPSYMAPEQASGATRQIGPAVDIYALGAILYEMLTGRPPFRAETPWDTITQVISAEPAEPSRFQKLLPRDLETICLKCLRKEPERRYSSAHQLAEDLQRFQNDEPIQARPVSRLERAYRWSRRKPALAGALAATLFSLLTGTVVSTYYALEAHQRRKQAESNAAQAATNAQQAIASAEDADRSARRAEMAAQFASGQRDLALEALAKLIGEVQDRLKDAPQTRTLKQHLLAAAVGALTRFSTSVGDAPVNDRSQAQARLRLGELFQQIGNDTAAAKEYRQSLEILESLPESEKAGIPYRLEQASLLNKLAAVQVKAGDLPAARKSAEQALALAEPARAADTSSAPAREALVSASLLLGRLSLSQGDSAASQRYFEKLLRSIPYDDKGNPVDPKTWLPVSSARVSLGLMHLRRQEYSEARKQLQQAIILCRASAIQDPNNLLAKQSLAAALMGMGEASLAAGENDRARSQFREALGICRGLPDDANAKALLVELAQHFGQACFDRQEYGLARETYYYLAMAQSRSLAEADPEKLGPQTDYHDVEARLGEISLRWHGLIAAQDHFRQALAFSERVAKSQPSNSPWQRKHVLDLLRLADVSSALGNLAEARARYAQALSLIDIGHLTGKDDELLERIAAQQGLGAVSLKLGKLREARDWLTKACIGLQKLSATTKDHQEARHRMLWAYAELARATLGLPDTSRLPQLLAIWIPGKSRTDSAFRPEHFLVNRLGMQMSLIPSGRFLMGTTEAPESLVAEFNRKLPSEKIGLFQPELPAHEVEISKGFYLGTTEVTVAQFRAFTTATGYRTDAERLGRAWTDFNPNNPSGVRANVRADWQSSGYLTEREPVVFVSWNDAIAFCRWLSKVEGVRYRLPTEAEWEYACRAGTNTRFYNGNDPENLIRIANVPDATFQESYNEERLTYSCLEGRDGFSGRAPVGSFAPNRFGLFDMHGNVWEWCEDDFDPTFYARSPRLDPVAKTGQGIKAIRGGCFM